jgi:hypothetical protein
MLSTKRIVGSFLEDEELSQVNLTKIHTSNRNPLFRTGSDIASQT